MTKKRHICAQIAVAGIIALILDAIILGWLANDFYAKQLHFLLRPDFAAPQLVAALIVYILIGLGQVFFVRPTEHKWHQATLAGAVFGFVTYGIYEFTNYALIITWKFPLVIADVIWGTALNAIIALALWKFFSKK